MNLNRLFYAWTLSTSLCLSAPVFAKIGTESGGGGDASEVRVDEIRSDILKWIKSGGAKKLELPHDISYGEYESKMTEILAPQKVVVGFVTKDSTDDEELSVAVKGIPKTCRGFISRKDSRPHILCNISRFAKTKDSEQYKLIHHEYAGLVNVENNEGAASDYVISSQLTDFLQEQKVLKLAIAKKKKGEVELLAFCTEKLDSIVKENEKIKELLETNKIDASEESILQDFNDSSAEAVALTCAGMKKIELEDSWRARFGLLSVDKAEAMAEEVREKAMKYYKDNKR